MWYSIAAFMAGVVATLGVLAFVDLGGSDNRENERRRYVIMMRLFNGDAFLEELAWACGCTPKDMLVLLKRMEKEGLLTQEFVETETKKMIVFRITVRGDRHAEDLMDEWLEKKNGGN